MQLEQVFASVFGIATTDVNDELQLKEIAAWDSMSHMMLILQLEEAFAVELTGDQIADMKSVGDARKAITRCEAAA